MTGHYITGTKESPQDWKLKSEQLGFTHIEGNHCGANLGGILMRTIDRYGIRQKVRILTFFLVTFSYLRIQRLAGLLPIMPPTTSPLLEKWQGN